MSSNTCGITPGTVRAGCLTDDTSTDGTVKAAPPAVFFNRILLQAFALLMLLPVLASSAFAFIEGDRISPTLEGCRQATPNTIILPSPSLNGSPTGFVCEEGLAAGGLSEGSYTTGNLKYWNEFDLVPHRVTLVRPAQSTTQQYNVTLAADSLLSGTPPAPGYDVLTEPVVNSASHPSCKVLDAGEQINGPPLTG